MGFVGIMAGYYCVLHLDALTSVTASNYVGRMEVFSYVWNRIAQIRQRFVVAANHIIQRSKKNVQQQIYYEY